MPSLVEGGQQGLHMAGGGHADGVAQAQFVAAQVEQRPADPDGLRDGHRALPGVAEAHREIAADLHLGVLGPRDDRREHRQRLVDRAVEVGLGEGLGGAAEHRDPAGAQGERTVQTAFVGHQDGQPVRVETVQQREQLLRVGELGHPLGVDEAGGLDGRQARVGEPADELGLDLRGHDGLLVL